MNCVVKSVNDLFPYLDLSQFKDRINGYQICDIQRMIPDKSSVWILISHYKHLSQREFDNITMSFLTFKDIKIPMFMFTKTHCFLIHYMPFEGLIYKIETETSYTPKSFFETHLIYQIACITSYDDYSILAL
jgi:hypothetical protein